MRKALTVTVLASAILYAGMVIAVVVFSEQFWLLDLLTFAWQYVVVAGLVLLVAASLTKAKVAVALALSALLISIYPYAAVPAAQTAARCSFRVLTANLFIENTNGPDQFLELIRKEQPDLLVLQETPDTWQDPIRNLGLFPYETTRDLMTYDRVKVFSRFPILRESMVSDPAIDEQFHKHPVRLELGGWNRSLVLYAIHPDTPRSLQQWRERNLHLETLASSVRSDLPASDVVVAGDWNTPRASGFYRDVLKKAGLGVAGDGDPWITSRFSLKLYPYFYLGSTIDHVAVSAALAVSDRRTGPMYGSNHLPVIADIGRSAPDDAQDPRPDGATDRSSACASAR